MSRAVLAAYFYDRFNSGDWDADFAFTQDVGRHFIKTYADIVRRRMSGAVDRR